MSELHRQLHQELVSLLSDRMQVAGVELLEQPKAVADDVAKLLVRDEGGVPRAVVLCSSATAPDLVRRGMDRARCAKQLLGDELGGVILEPIGEGCIGPRSYAVLPYCRPIQGTPWLQRKWWRGRVRAPVLTWWREATAHTAQEVPAEEIEGRFVAPLEHLARLDGASGAIRAATGRAVERLAAARWKPRYQIMHGDLWIGNVLRRTRSERGHQSRLVVIDWPGSLERGYGLLDLLRLLRSLRVSSSRGREEVERHCRILGCERADARSHLHAALGHLAQHIENFPLDRFLTLCDAMGGELTRLGIE